MKKRLFLGFLLVALAAMAACGARVQDNAPEANGAIIEEGPFGMPHGALAVEYIEFINDNFYSRLGFTYRELETANWIVDELLAMGYAQDDILIQEFAHFAGPFSWVRNFHVMSAQPMFAGADIRASRLSQNVILTIPGQSEGTIIIGAHYDSVNYPGASDNASGMALLLESAARMRYFNNYHTLVYIFFGAEEVGLLGAFYYVESLSEAERDNILFMINADVLFEGRYFIYAAGYLEPAQPGQPMMGGITRQNDLTRKWDDIAYDLQNIYDITLIPYYRGLNLGSDHIPFKHEGITVMFLLGLESAGYTFVPAILHSYRDDIHWINENAPGKIEDAMRTFSIFLERVLLARYY
jgi:hypothetical protein